jgi:hypothetical protein
VEFATDLQCVSKGSIYPNSSIVWYQLTLSVPAYTSSKRSPTCASVGMAPSLSHAHVRAITRAACQKVRGLVHRNAGTLNLVAV